MRTLDAIKYIKTCPDRCPDPAWPGLGLANKRRMRARASRSCVPARDSFHILFITACRARHVWRPRPDSAQTVRGQFIRADSKAPHIYSFLPVLSSHSFCTRFVELYAPDDTRNQCRACARAYTHTYDYGFNMKYYWFNRCTRPARIA